MTGPVPRKPRNAGEIGFADRLLAEAVCAVEREGAADQRQADDAARAAGGDFETRIVVRARSLAMAEPLREALRQVRRATTLIGVVIMLVAVLAGAGAARAALREQAVNFFWAMGGLLGIQTILLAAWALMMWRGPQALSGGSAGGVVLALGRRMALRWQATAASAAAIEATGAVYGRGSMGRWMFSAISHGLWVAFNAACLLMVILTLIASEKRFVWETTILSADAYTRLTQTMAWLPGKVGFRTPTDEQVAASNGATDETGSEAMRHAWSGLLVGSLVIYALAPRLLLFGLCLGRARGARARWRLDTSRPGYLRLQSTLMPQAERLGVVDPAGATGGEVGAGAGASLQPQPAPPGGFEGDPVILGLEIEPPGWPWPPAVDGVRWEDLGLVDDRGDRQRVLSRLGSLSDRPRIVVVVCSLSTTPDRGHRSFLISLQEAAGTAVGLVLSGGEVLRRRGDAGSVQRRVEDWQRLAADAGIAQEHMVEVDLDHLTDASMASLVAFLGGPAAPPAGRRIESACDLIIDHLGRWRGEPDTKQQVELHRAIGGLYRSDHSSWSTFLRAPAALEGDLKVPLKEAADRVTRLLPGRLRANPRWLAAGALAGALGCVAAATLLSPVAIASLGVWSALGAAIAAVAGGSRPQSQQTPQEDEEDERAPALRAAALFALVLELQGRDEAQITRILERVIGDENDAVDDGEVATARRWLDGIRHRLDLALAAEEAS